MLYIWGPRFREIWCLTLTETPSGTCILRGSESSVITSLTYYENKHYWSSYFFSRYDVVTLVRRTNSASQLEQSCWNLELPEIDLGNSLCFLRQWFHLAKALDGIDVGL
jgi:hypothetical protein